MRKEEFAYFFYPDRDHDHDRKIVKLFLPNCEVFLAFLKIPSYRGSRDKDSRNFAAFRLVGRGFALNRL